MTQTSINEKAGTEAKNVWVKSPFQRFVRCNAGTGVNMRDKKSLNITDNQYCVLAELAMRKTITEYQFTGREKVLLHSLAKRNMVFWFSQKWRITKKGFDASHRHMQLLERDT